MAIALGEAERAHAKRVVAIKLKVGELRDVVDEWLQRYFEQVGRGTIAEHARLEIVRSPVVLECAGCTHTFQIAAKEVGGTCCPRCRGARATIKGGRELCIEGIEVICGRDPGH